MKIKLYQKGGMPNFVYEPMYFGNKGGQLSTTTATPIAHTNTKSDESKKSTLDIINLINGLDGLPSDNYRIIRDVLNFFIYGSAKDPTALVQQYLSTLALVKTAKYNKDTLDKAQEKAASKDGLNEVALTADGRIYVQNIDTKKIQAVTPNQYLDNLLLYVKLTNSDILYLRAHDTTGTIGNHLVSDVNNAIGWSKVLELIKNAIPSTIESTKRVEEAPLYAELGEIYGIKPSGLYGKLGYKLVEGHYNTKELLQYLNNEGGNLTDFINGSFPTQGAYSVSKTIENNLALLYNLAESIYNVLPKNAQNLLILRSGSESQAIDMIGKLVVNPRVKDVSELKIEFKSDPYEAYRSKFLDETVFKPIERVFQLDKIAFSKALGVKEDGTTDRSSGKGSGKKGDSDNPYEELKYSELERFAMGDGTKAGGTVSKLLQLSYDKTLGVNVTNVTLYNAKDGTKNAGSRLLKDMDEADIANIMGDQSVGGIPIDSSDRLGVFMSGTFYHVQYVKKTDDLGGVVPYLDYLYDLHNGNFSVELKNFIKRNGKGPSPAQARLLHRRNFNGYDNAQEMQENFIMTNAYVNEDEKEKLLAKVPKEKRLLYELHFIKCSDAEADLINRQVNNKLTKEEKKESGWDGDVYKVNFSAVANTNYIAGEQSAEEMVQRAQLYENAASLQQRSVVSRVNIGQNSSNNNTVWSNRSRSGGTVWSNRAKGVAWNE